MTHRKTTSTAVLALLTLCLFIPATGSAASLQGPAKEMFGANGLSWASLVPYDSATLRIGAQDGTVWEQHISAGEPLSLIAPSADGAALPDGVLYLRAAAASADRPAERTHERGIAPELDSPESSGRRVAASSSPAARSRRKRTSPRMRVRQPPSRTTSSTRTSSFGARRAWAAPRVPTARPTKSRT